MGHPLKILIVEDEPADAELLLRALRHAGYELNWRRVDSEEEFVVALTEAPELVLSDYQMPQFNGLRALELLRASGREIPFILVSGTIGEETAVAAMKQGAADYLLKDRLTRLGPAVEQALDQARLRRERAEALGAQRASERLAHAALNSLRAHVAILDETGVVLTTNQAWLKFAAENPAAPESMGVGGNYLLACEGTVGPRAVAAGLVASAIRDALGGHEKDFELEYRRPRLGGEGWFAARVASFHSAGPRRVVVSHEDITARKLQDEALRESDARFRQVVETIREVFWMTDVTKNQMLYVSPGYETIWGRTCASLYAASESWIESIHPEDRARVLEAAGAKQVLGTYDEIYRVVRPDGSVRWIHDKAFPVKNADGTVTRVVGVADDITERKQLEEQFLRAQRMEAIGTLSSGIAHDLNNILVPMLMVAPLLRDEQTTPREHELLEMVERSAMRGANIIKQLLTFSRGVEGDRGPVQARHLVKEMCSLMRETFPREISITQELAHDLRPVEADATQLHQVLMNLCVNARDAMPQGGTLTIHARNVVLTETDRHLSPNLTPGPHVELAIEDTGEGIPQEIMGRIFEPFFSTKEVGRGTGLGLSTVLGIVKSHGGFVTVQSEPGRGACFSVFLPALIDAVEASQGTNSGQMLMGHDELILVVDDEALNREVLLTLLVNHRYTVLCAGNGKEALAMLLAHRGRVRLLLTDMMMPQMGGVALVRAVRTVEPYLPIVAMSGLEDEERTRDLAVLGVKQILAKPCEAKHVLWAVHRALSQGV
ncbi:MAG: response regulator [Opitutaceae bacterium]